MASKKDTVKKVFQSLLEKQDLSGMKNLWASYQSVVRGELEPALQWAMAHGHERTPILLFQLMRESTHGNSTVYHSATHLAMACAYGRNDLVYHLLDKQTEEHPWRKASWCGRALRECVLHDRMELLDVLCRWQNSKEPMGALGWPPQPFQPRQLTGLIRLNDGGGDELTVAIHTKNMDALKILWKHGSDPMGRTLAVINRLRVGDPGQDDVVRQMLLHTSCRKWMKEHPYATTVFWGALERKKLINPAQHHKLLASVVDFDEVFVNTLGNPVVKNKDYQRDLMMAYEVLGHVSAECLAGQVDHMQEALERQEKKPNGAVSAEQIQEMSAAITSAHVNAALQHTQTNQPLGRKRKI